MLRERERFMKCLGVTFNQFVCASEKIPDKIIDRVIIRYYSQCSKSHWVEFQEWRKKIRELEE